MTAFEQALVLHLVGDWLLQNDWMARHKINLRHPAAWVHATIHAVLLSVALGWVGGVVLGLLHLAIDTRVPQIWWGRVFGQTHSGEASLHVMIWGDQVLHIGTIALWVLLAPHLHL
jgi:hypothetical protein